MRKFNKNILFILVTGAAVLLCTTPTVMSHCEIPCGIYNDAIRLDMIAENITTIEKAMNNISELSSTKEVNYNQLIRWVNTKEEHAEKTKHEIRVIWGDYLKEQHFANHPTAQDLVHKIMMLGSKSRQGVDRDNAVQLVEAVNDFAEIFWATKGVATKRAKAPYAPALELVYPDL